MSEGNAAAVEGQAKPSKAPEPCGPLVSAANRVSWLKVIITSGVGLLAAGAATALYASQFASHDEVVEAVEKHEGSPVAHPSTQAEIRGVSDRLIRVEVTQQRMETTLQRVDEKLERLVEGLPSTRYSPYAPPRNPP